MNVLWHLTEADFWGEGAVICLGNLGQTSTDLQWSKAVDRRATEHDDKEGCSKPAAMRKQRLGLMPKLVSNAPYIAACLPMLATGCHAFVSISLPGAT